MKKIIILTLAAVLAAALQTDACTGITLRVPDRGTVVARTIEWGGSDLNSRYVVVPRGYRQHSMLPDQKKGMLMPSRYGYVGLAVEMEQFVAEGINEAGLSAGLFYFPDYGRYEEYDPALASSSVADLQLVAWMLGGYATVDEVMRALRGIHVVEYTQDALREVGAHVVSLARAEDLPGHGEAVLARVPEVEPGEGEVRLKIAYVGICGSDLHEYLAGPVFIPVEAPHPLTGLKDQCILGHEFSGEIVRLGNGVTGFAVGQAVAADACQHCGTCYYCRHGLYNICENLAFTGLMNNGAFAEYVNVPANLLYALPAGFPSEAGALIEPLAVGMHAVKKAGSLLGQNVVVVGAGTIGLSTIMCARAAGAAQVIALEMSSARKAKALEVGASQVLDPSRCDALGEIRALTGGLGADVSFECIGNKHTAKLAIDAIRKAGKCVLVGIFEEPSEFNFFELVSTEKQLLGALAYNGEFADVIAFIADGRLDIAPLVTGRIGLEEIVERGFEELVNNKEHNVKIIVSPGG